MTLVWHELRQGRLAFWIWTASIGFFLMICVFMFPEMKDQMEGVSEMFASMGSFTEAFGMDRLSFGTLLGFYSVECGNILGLGGAFYAAFCAVGMLSKEEKDHTAEFLLTHPISRRQVVTEKLIAIVLQIVAMNLIIFALSVFSIAMVGEDIPWKELNLIHLAYFLLQLELAGICFGVSAFLRKGGMGIGLGLAILMYFLNLIANISDSAEFLKFITPFGYCEGADIVADGCLNGAYVAIGLALGAAGILLAYLQYTRKDIH